MADLPTFRTNEVEPVRVPKLNQLSSELGAIAGLVTGIGGVVLAGGDAFGDGGDNIIIDGGSADTTWL